MYFIDEHFFILKKEEILLEGCTSEKYGEHRYILYKNIKDGQIHVNTEYCNSDQLKPEEIRCCKYYDRSLYTDSISNISEDTIESQAYGSWMDGAR